MLVAACEVILARLSFAPLSSWDLATSLLALPLLALLLVEGLRRVATLAGRGEHFYVAFAMYFFPSVVLARLLGNAALSRGQILATLLTISVAALPPLLLALRARRGGRLDPSNASVVAAFACVTLAAIALRAGTQVVPFGDDGVSGSVAGLPPLAVCAGVLGLWLAAALLTVRPILLPAALALTTVVAFWPRSAPTVQWTAADGAPARAGAPDIILLTVDTLRADATGTMRSFARLGRRGVVFAAARAPAPWTLPSLASMMTGRLPSAHGALLSADGRVQSIDPEVETLAERLARAGYDTAAVLAPNAFVGRAFGLTRGFAHVESMLRRAAYAQPRSSNDVVARPIVPSLLARIGLGGRRRFGDAANIADEAIAVLDQRRDRPLFLWVHFLDCHIPYRHAGETNLPYRIRTALSGGDPVEMARRGLIDADIAWPAYRNEIRHIDAALLRILDRLDQSPRAKLVALTSDHGEEFFDHGGFEHGHSLFEELLRVPLVVAGLSNRPAGSTEPSAVGLRDLTPTVLDAAGLPFEGQSLARPIAPRRFVASNLLYGDPELYAVYNGRWKLIASRDGRAALYDLASDPQERVDRAESLPEVVRELAVAPPIHRKHQARSVPALTATQENAMRMLGYLSDR